MVFKLLVIYILIALIKPEYIPDDNALQFIFKIRDYDGCEKRTTIELFPYN